MRKYKEQCSTNGCLLFSLFSWYYCSSVINYLFKNMLGLCDFGIFAEVFNWTARPEKDALLHSTNGLPAIDYYTPGILKYAGSVNKCYSSLSQKRDPGLDQIMSLLATRQPAFIADK